MKRIRIYIRSSYKFQLCLSVCLFVCLIQQYSVFGALLQSQGLLLWLPKDDVWAEGQEVRFQREQMGASTGRQACLILVLLFASDCYNRT